MANQHDHDPYCACQICCPWLAQQNAPAPQAQNNFLFAEWQTASARLRPDLPSMWVEDLGLPLALWNEMGEAYWDFVFGRRKSPDAPYAFWLGADA